MHGSTRLLPGSVLLAGALALAGGARAADWVERPFDPPVGSRWIIQSDDTAETNKGGSAQTSVIRMTSELTIEAKTAEGYRVTYVVRHATYEGDARAASVVGPVTKALENLVVHATLGPNGMPLRVDNLAEVQAAARTAIDRLTAPLAGKPEAAAALRKIATGMLVGSGKQASRIYLGNLRTLALGQNTGLHPSETRRDVDEVANPLGGAPIKSNAILRMDSADPATGNVRLTRTRSFNAGAIKDLLGRVVKQIGGDDKNMQMFGVFMKQLTAALDSRMEIDVEGGMTRAVREEETTTANVLGRSMVKHEHKRMTVTRAP